MKAFLNYSGKGGVGKSTTTYCLYMAMKKLGHDVKVLDMDMNTPSMHLLLDDQEDLISNHEFKGLFLDKAIISLFLKNSIAKIKELNPEVLLIDTPPSITDIHLTIIDKLNISAVVLVSQPSELSKSDVERTIPFFENEGITVVGIVENMVENNGLEYRYEKLLEVPKSKGLDTKLVYRDNEKPFIKLAKTLLNANLHEVSQENRKKTILDESIDWETVKDLYRWGIEYDGDGGHHYTTNIHLKDIRFVNISTWSELQEAICGWRNQTCLFHGEDWVSKSSTEHIERLIRAFEGDDAPLFMIIKNPMTEIPTITGEFASCVFKMDEKFNGIPCVEYRTDKGAVRMFPYEVMPATEQMIKDALKTKRLN